MKSALHLLACSTMLISSALQAGTLSNQIDTHCSQLAEQIDPTHYREQLEKVATPRIRNSENHANTVKYLYKKLNELGYQVELQPYSSGTNLVARKIGRIKPKEEVIISAHYDSISESNLACDGTDDNASGVAGVLEIARVFANKQFTRTLTFAFWDEEELGLLGSKAYLTNQTNKQFKTKMAFDFEMIGYKDDNANTQTLPYGFELFFPNQYQTIKHDKFRANFIGLVSDDSKIALKVNQYLQTMATSLALPTMTIALTQSQRSNPLFSDFKRSDHASFWEQGFAAVMLSDTANFRNPNYHCNKGNQDSISTIDIDFASNVVKATSYAAAKLLVPFQAKP